MWGGEGSEGTGGVIGRAGLCPKSVPLKSPPLPPLPPGVAVIMVHEPKKQFYKRFLYEPFPEESSLKSQVQGGRGRGGEMPSQQACLP